MSNLIRGGGGGGGKGGGTAYKPKTAPDGLDSTQYAQLIDLISEGEIQGLKDGLKSVFINNTPLENSDSSLNFQGITVYTRNGTQSQEFIPIAANVQNEIGVGVTVLKTVPVVRTISDPDVDAVRVTVSVPTLQSFTDKGDLLGTSVQLEIAVQYAGGGFTPVINDTITGRTGDLYQRKYRIDFNGPKPVDIRLTRITDDSTNPKLVNSFSWSSYTEITAARLRYPNSALVGIRVNSEQFNSIPERSYLIRGIKVKIPVNATVNSNRGALIYSGIWNGTFGAAQWCSDPAWILWDLLTSTRYGFGDHVQAAQLDKWAFYAASHYASALNTYNTAAEISYRASKGLPPRTGTTDDYNSTTGRHGVPDGFGKYEPRFSCNVNIQTQEEAYKLINDMCSVFRAMPYWSTGALTVSQDKPADPSYLFTLANVSEGGFTYQSSARKNRPTVAVVSYFDLASREIAYESVEDQAAIAKYGVVTTQISAFACTSRGQAARLGEWLLYAEQYEAEIISFTASIDAGVIVRPGQIIEVADPLRAGSRRGGRISAATTTTVTVDDATGLPSSGGTVSAILPNGTVEQKTMSSRTGKVLTVSSAFSVAPNANSVWIYQSNEIQASTWRVLAVQEQDGSNYLINALAYNASKYDYIERDRPLQPRDVTNLNEVPAAPSSLSLSEELYLYQNQLRSKIVASWTSVSGVVQYEVRWRKDNGNWTAFNTLGPDHELLDVTPGYFEFQVFSLSSSYLRSNAPAAANITALGKIAPPSNVTGFSIALDPDIGVTLSWNSVSDLDLQGYEIWEGAAWGTGIKIGLFQTTSAKVGFLPTNTVTWWIKALDTSGVYSTTATSVSVTIDPAGVPPSFTGTFKGTDIELRWAAIAGSLATQSYEIRYGTTSSTWETATVAGRVQGTVYSTKASWSGVRRWFVAAVDLKGSAGAAAITDTTVNIALQPSITQQVVDNNVLLQWNDVTQTLPIESYELRKGNTWATATVIGTKQGRFTSVFEVASGTYTYWLAAIDSAGNYGTPGSVSAVVNQPPDYQLQFDYNSTFSGTRTNVAVEGGKLVAAVNTTETWQQHFTTRSWTTPQDQINAGYAYYALPSATSGVYEEEIDYGTTLASTKLTATITAQVVTGALTVTPRLSTRPAATTAATYSRSGTTITVTSTAHGLVAGDSVYLQFTSGAATTGNYTVATAVANSFTVTSAASGTTSGNVNWGKWTDFNGVSEAYVTNFRHAKIRYDFASAGGNDLWTASALNIRMDAKLKNAFGNGTAAAPVAATYSQSGTTITVTATAHGLAVGAVINLDFTTGTATDGNYTIATAATNSFTVTSATSATTSGNVTIHGGGTVVAFGTTFIDVQAISVTPLTTSAIIAVYDFVDVPNPTSFKVLLFDTSGTRVGGTFSWSARGV